jgi:tRNA(Leu) C34 or U34 (ribose-2'-O)-methylase TrmL
MNLAQRGFSIVALHNPKSGENVGGALRAAAVYGSAGVIVDGPRRNVLIQHPTNTMKAHLHLPVTWIEDLFDAIPHGAVPVAVEIAQNAKSLIEFKHPERAVYIFGAEDATLGVQTLARCVHSVYIPTKRCMNLAATVNVVLYDRLAKSGIGFETAHGEGQRAKVLS